MPNKPSNLPQSVIACMRPADRKALGLTIVVPMRSPMAVEDRQQARRRRGGPTKTEAEYARLYLAGTDARFEALTFRFANGHRYTPDWSYRDNGDSGRLVCVEVKGSYRLGSYQRARLAFDQAAIEWPAVRWIWAERRKDGSWRVDEKAKG
jgi:hypothetical protein